MLTTDVDALVDRTASAISAGCHQRAESMIKHMRHTRQCSSFQYEIDYKDLQFGKMIGKGEFGEVYAAKLWGVEVAVKQVRYDKDVTAKQMQEFLQEVSVMKNLRHANIVSFCGAVLTPRMCIVSELLTHGNLEELLLRNQANNTQLSLYQTVHYAMDIARGLNWLHHKGIIHRDLKAPNILIGSDNSLCIADFGLSHVLDRKKEKQVPQEPGCYGVCGTKQYMAPEVLMNAAYSLSADVYSYGILLVELINSRPAWAGVSVANLGESLRFEEAVIWGLTPIVRSDCPPLLSALVQSCIHPYQEQRPDMDKVDPPRWVYLSCLVYLLLFSFSYIISYRVKGAG